MRSTLLCPNRPGWSWWILVLGLIGTPASRADSGIAAWGYYWYINGGPNQFSPVNRPPGVPDAVALSGGAGHSLALRADGTVTVWGDGSMHQRRVPDGLSNIVAISASSLAHHGLALRADGTLLAWGAYDSAGGLDVPAGLTNVADFAGGGIHNLVLKEDGAVIAWGAGANFNPSTGADYGQSIVPVSLTNTAAVAAGYLHSLALTGELAPFLTGPFIDRTVVHGTTTWFRAAADGSGPLRYQWRRNGSNLPGATNAVLALENVTFDSAGAYAVEVSNALGAAPSPEMVLRVAPLFLTSQPRSLILLRGQTATFEVTPSGTGPFTFQWHFNRTDLPGETNRSLVLTNVQAGQRGTYAVTVAHELGSVRSADATLSLTEVIAWGSNVYGQTNVPAGLSEVTALAGGLGFSLALKSDGTVVAWGRNVYGETDVPAGLTNGVSIAAGNSHALALTSAGRVVGWGLGAAAEIPGDLTNVTAVAAGATHSLALGRDGTVVAWGSGTAGQTDVPSGLSNVVGVAAASSYSLGLLADGTVKLWGTMLQFVPLPGMPTPPPLTNVVALAAGPSHYVALRADGTVTARGTDRYDAFDALSRLTNVVAIAAGENHTLALRADGTVVAFGAGATNTWPRPGPPGPPSYGQSTVPTNLTNVVAIGAGYNHSLAAVGGAAPSLLAPLADRTLLHGTTAFLRASAAGARPLQYQWRFNGADLPGATNAVLELAGVEFADAGRYSVVIRNALGEIASPEMAPAVAPLFITAAPQGRSVCLGSTITLSVSAASSLPCRYQWRFNGADLPGATNRTLLLTNLQIDRSGSYSVVVRNEFGSAVSGSAAVSVGQVMAWGDNAFGQTNLPPGLTSIVAVAAGDYHSLALKSDGTVFAWGQNTSGSTGNSENDVPPDLTNAVAIAAGSGFSLALKADGTVAAWGANDAGQTQVPADLRNVIALAAGGGHGLALASDGTVRAWGYNDMGQAQVPVGLSNVTAIGAGMSYSIALTVDGTVRTWGDNSWGSTGPPDGLSGVTAIAAGWQHCVALKGDGTVTVWGAHYAGQTNVPAGLTNVVAIWAGGHHSLARKADGSLVAWGSVPPGNPFLAPDRTTNLVALAAGAAHDLAVLRSPPLLALEQPPEANLPAFLQTGLRWQVVRVTNPNGQAFPAVRVLVQNLAPGSGVYNASGTNAQGQPYLQVNQALAPGASVELTIEYFVPSRSIPEATLTVEAADPAPPFESTGHPQDILRSVRMDDGSYLIDFATLANRTYYLQYSADLGTWRTAFPPVTGTGSTMQWVDNGPPKTDSHPGTQTNRFYRVLLAP